MNTCQLTTLRKHSEGDKYAPMLQNGDWHLVAQSGAVLVGFRGAPYNFASAENAQTWLDANLLRTARGGASSNDHLLRLVTLQSQIMLAELAVEIQNVTDRNAGLWNVVLAPSGNTYIINNPGEIGATGEKGDTGDVGAQGLKGDKGDTGEKGLQGIQGVQGVQGVQGLQGAQGSNGINASVFDSVKFFAQSLYAPSVQNSTVNATGSMAMMAGAPTVGVLYLRPIVLDADKTISNLYMSVAALAAAGNSIAAGIYSSVVGADGLLKPNALLASGSASSSTAGLKTIALNNTITLSKGVVYFLASTATVSTSMYLHNATVLASLGSNGVNIGVSAGLQYSLSAAEQSANAWVGGVLPAAISQSLVVAGSTVFPAIFFAK